jgi:hypothetical protein
MSDFGTGFRCFTSEYPVKPRFGFGLTVWPQSMGPTVDSKADMGPPFTELQHRPASHMRLAPPLRR